MDAVERIVRSWMVSEDDAEVERLVAGVSSGSATFLDIVKALGEYLTSEEDHLRTKGVQMLSIVIERCPRDKLNRQAVRVLTTFYCSKLEDTETVTPALCGLSHLVIFPSFSSLEVSDVLSAIFQHVKMKSLVQPTRLYVYSIVDTLLNAYLDHLKSMGEDFLSSYAALATDEKDPRNLLVAFKIAHVILTNFDISKHVEAYFDVVFCYFPITYRPRPDDTQVVDVDDLICSLRACLSATPAFGSLGTTFFLEKLAIGSPFTKRDVLQTMTVCLPVYGIDAAIEFGQNIWSALKLEIFQPTDSLTEQMALDTLRAFVRVLLAAPSGGTNDTIHTVFRTLCVDTLDSIGEPEKAQAGIKVLRTLVDVPSKPGNDVINDAIDKLTIMFHDPGEVTNRAAIIVHLTNLLKAFVPSTMDELPLRDTPSPVSSILTSHKEAVLGVLIIGLKSSATRLPAIHGLLTLTLIPALLTSTDLGYIVLETGKFVQKEPDEVEDVTNGILSLLSSVAATEPRQLAEQILPSLFTMLPEQAPPGDALSERTGYWRALSALKKLCLQPTLFEILVIRLIAKLELLCSLSVLQAGSLGGTTQAEETERSAAYAHALLLTLANTLSEKVSKASPDPDVPKYVDRLLSHLFRLFLEAAVTNGQQIFRDPRLLRVGARIVKLVVEALSIEQQQVFINGMNAAFIYGQVKVITGGEFPSLTDEFRPFHAVTSSQQREAVILFAAAYIPVRKEVSVMTNSDSGGQLVLSTFLRDLVRWCDLSSCTILQREAASELFMTLVNKYPDDVSDFLDEILTSYFPTALNNPAVPLEARRKAIDNWVWISKALIVRSHPLASSFVDYLLTLLGDDGLGRDAARALGPLFSDDGVLLKRNGAVLKILHVQKYFSVALPKLIDGVNKVDGTMRETAYLTAIASLIKSVPRSLYGTQMPTLLPLLLRGLEVADLETLRQILETFSNNINTFSNDESSSAHAPTLVTTLLKNCTITDMPEQKVRVEALKCLGLLPGAVRYDLLHPYKSRVLKVLAKALDDPKRAVRKEAVEARTTWYKYSG